MACPFCVEETVGLQQIDAGTGEVVSLALVKAQLGIESTDWDALLGAYVSAAVGHVENVTGRTLGGQQWQITLPGFADVTELPRGPVTAVTTVTYLDTARVSRVLSPSVYIVDLTADPQVLVRDPEASWPATAQVPEAVAITFSTGYASAPAPIVQAIMLLVGWWFTQREAVNVGNIVTQVPLAFSALVAPYRRLVI